MELDIRDALIAVARSWLWYWPMRVFGSGNKFITPAIARGKVLPGDNEWCRRVWAAEVKIGQRLHWTLNCKVLAVGAVVSVF